MNDLLDILMEAGKTSYKTGRWYHVTTNHFGNRVKFSPRSPINATGDEPMMSRICVADTIEGCFVALGGLLDEDTVYVYQTAEAVPAWNPVSVVDANVTGEKWLFHITEFVRVKTIKMNEIPLWLKQSLWALNIGRIDAVPNQKQVRGMLKKFFEGKTPVVSESDSGSDAAGDGIKTISAPMNFDMARSKRIRKRPDKGKEND